jgi:S-adenosylmethionine:tRNA ribosyltransferase-isomerase
MQLKEFDYILPEDLIAQYPNQERSNSRLMVVDRKSYEISHRRFFNLIEYLNEGDCLVLNNSKVIPARLFGTKISTGARVEFLLIKRIKNDIWQTMVRPGKRVHLGDEFVFSSEDNFKCVIKENSDEGTRIVEFSYDGIFQNIIEKVGKMPLPPYIDRENELSDKERYQTVYCENDGSVAAPTAGLHFTNELLKKIEEKGVKLAYVTLHVGIGTFRPVSCENILDHKMHYEECYIDKETSEVINKAKQAGGKIVSVGTTSARALESATGETGILDFGNFNTDIFIYPGYKFKIVDSLITNFHLPKSTLLMLISAFYDREKVLEAYEVAISEKYKFFSYGDAMLLL